MSDGKVIINRDEYEELISDRFWKAYAVGCEDRESDSWWDGGMSDAEWLGRQLSLLPGRHKASEIKRMIEGAVRSTVEQASSA